MQYSIRKYNPSLDFDRVNSLLRSEGAEWEDYLKPEYQIALENSITYVAFNEKELCGYSRSINDSGLFIWIVDLLVHKNHRGNALGRRLMDCVLNDYAELEAFVMSDVDPYYEKLGYKKEGSIFKVSKVSFE